MPWFSVDVQAEIYKWRDERGVTHYSDVPPTRIYGVDKLDAGNSAWPLTRADAGQQAEESAAKNQTSRKSPEDASAGNRQRLTEYAQQTDARLKAQNCAHAHSNYRNYALGGRIQSVNERGEKSYMSDEEIHEGMLRAQQEIDANCAP